MKRRIQMIYTCDQSPESMAHTERGRYCTLCCREVVDYRNTPAEKIPQNPDTMRCGIFTPQQIDPSLLSPVRIPYYRKMLAWVSTAVLVLSGSSVKAGTRFPFAMEQHRIPSSMGDTVYAEKQKSVREAVKTEKEPEKEKVWEPRKNRYYFSRRFPFIRKVRYRYPIMGRFL
jgi:hypothetical protein